MNVHAPSPGADAVRTLVIGGGIVGLSIAWELGRRGHPVTLVDPDPAGGATFAAAGMLAPVSEFHYQEQELLGLTFASAAAYPAFARDLAEASGTDPGYRTRPTLVVGLDSADRTALADLAAAQRAHGLEVEDLGTREARRREPLLSPAVSSAQAAPGDHQVDPRAMAASLQAALAALPQARTVAATAVALLHDDPADPEGVTGAALDTGQRLEAQETVLACGLGAAAVEGLPTGLELRLRPVHGDILRLRAPERLRPLVQHTVRGLVHGRPVYLVPREDGTVVLGATQRENSEPGPQAGGVYELLRDAQAIVPAVAELELLEVTSRARPGTPDNAPLLGRCRGADGVDVPGLVIATGFFRHGVLLSPAAAHVCADLIGGGRVDLTPFRPDRFSRPATPPARLTPARSTP
ncbi:glycine oxidase ThiO [Zhihengliuella sp.]|uniref:glycine oxidase ThiO n=1 Tax=Zhihengliuella sp. TaxID=1954483 RepID=UPI0028118EA3|nr:glycine oxidase ThiO [Zhihengliuella sp.]